MDPNLTSTNKAAEGITYPDDMRIMNTNPSNPDAYPITGFSLVWLINISQNPGEAGDRISVWI